MAIPTFVIHTVVHQSHKILEKYDRLPTRIRAYAPSGLGLCCIPLLPVSTNSTLRQLMIIFPRRVFEYECFICYYYSH